MGVTGPFFLLEESSKHGTPPAMLSSFTDKFSDLSVSGSEQTALCHQPVISAICPWFLAMFCCIVSMSELPNSDQSSFEEIAIPTEMMWLVALTSSTSLSASLILSASPIWRTSKFLRCCVMLLTAASWWAFRDVIFRQAGKGASPSVKVRAPWSRSEPNMQCGHYIWSTTVPVSQRQPPMPECKTVQISWSCLSAERFTIYFLSKHNVKQSCM